MCHLSIFFFRYAEQTHVDPCLCLVYLSQVVYGEASATKDELIGPRCTRVARELVAKGVDAVAGPPSSPCSVPAAEVFAAAGVPQVSARE